MSRRGARAPRTTSSWRLGALAANGLFLLLAGCSGLEPREPLPPPPRGHASGKLALAPIRVAYAPNDAEHPAFLHHHPALDWTRFDRRSRELPGERGFLELIAPIATTVVAAPTAPGANDEQLERNLRTASERGAASLLDVTVDEATVNYVGQRGIFAAKVVIAIGINVLIFPFVPDFPNFFIASDRFELVARARWRLVDVKSGVEVARGIELGRQEGTFGDLSRGWYYYSIVRVPGCLDEESWEEIAKALSPGAEESLAGALAVAAEKAVLESEKNGSSPRK